MGMAPTWITRWRVEIAPTKLPGVWRLRSGGFLVRARAADPSGRLHEIRLRLPEARSEAEAFASLTAERARIRAGSSAPKAKPLFSAFAISLLDEKIALRDIKSARGREKWKHALKHLIEGTGSVTGFGDLRVDAITETLVDEWRVEIAKLIAKGEYSPHTPNTWLGIFKTITRAARKKFGLPVDPAEDAKYFDTSEHPAHTEEEPHSLTADEARRFLAAMRSDFPQHYAMTCLGFATGLRPSHLRPLRRSGSRADVLWDERQILVRRSHTLGETMERTKTGLRQKLNVPPQLVSILRWHVETQLVTEEQQASSLLFPAEDGRPRSESCLKKPFATCAKLLGFKKRITPKAMRRTFNDLSRLARVEGIVTRSISGHLTETMHEHYQTVSPEEQRAAVRGVLSLVGARGGGRRRRAG